MKSRQSVAQTSSDWGEESGTATTRTSPSGNTGRAMLMARASHVHQSESPEKSDLSDSQQVPRWSNSSHPPPPSELSFEDDLRSVPDCTRHASSVIAAVPKQQSGNPGLASSAERIAFSKASHLRHSAASTISPQPSVPRSIHRRGPSADVTRPLPLPLASVAAEHGKGQTKYMHGHSQAYQVKDSRKAAIDAAFGGRWGREGDHAARDGWRAMAAVRDTMLKQQHTFMSQVKDMHDMVEVQRSWMQLSDPTQPLQPLLPLLTPYGDRTQAPACLTADPDHSAKRAKLAQAPDPLDGSQMAASGLSHGQRNAQLYRTVAAGGPLAGISHAAGSQSRGGESGVHRAPCQWPMDCQDAWAASPQQRGGADEKAGVRLFGAMMTRDVSHFGIGNKDCVQRGRALWELRDAPGCYGDDGPFRPPGEGAAGVPPASQGGGVEAGANRGRDFLGPGKQTVSKPKASRPGGSGAMGSELGLELQLGLSPSTSAGEVKQAGKARSLSSEGDVHPAFSDAQQPVEMQRQGVIWGGGVGQGHGQGRQKDVTSRQLQQQRPRPLECFQSSGASGSLLGPPPHSAPWALSWPPTLPPPHLPHHPPHLPHPAALSQAYSQVSAAWQPQGLPQHAQGDAWAHPFAAESCPPANLAAIGVPVPSPGQQLPGTPSFPVLGSGLQQPASLGGKTLWPPPQQQQQQQHLPHVQQQQALALCRLQTAACHLQYQGEGVGDLQQPIVGDARCQGQWLPMIGAGFCQAPGIWPQGAGAGAGAYVPSGALARDLAGGSAMQSQAQGSGPWPGMGFTPLPVPFASCAPVKRPPFKTPPPLVLLSNGTVKHVTQAGKGVGSKQERRRQEHQQQQQQSCSSSNTDERGNMDQSRLSVRGAPKVNQKTPNAGKGRSENQGRCGTGARGARKAHGQPVAASGENEKLPAPAEGSDNEQRQPCSSGKEGSSGRKIIRPGQKCPPANIIGSRGSEVV